MTCSPDNEHEEDLDPSNREDLNLEPQGTSRFVQRGSRKRTKTGCLTCRKRRIKCGEEKPICSNCTKSKRFCEGYNPRIVFRQPPPISGQTEGAFGVRPPLLSHFASFEGYPSAIPRLENGASAQSLRPIRPTPLQTHQHNYDGAINPTYVTPGGPAMPALTPGSFSANAAPFPPSADALWRSQTGSHYVLSDATRAVPHSSAQQHASISGLQPGNQSWAAEIPPQPVQGRHLLTRANSLTSYNPMVGVSTNSLPPRAFPPPTLPSGVPAPQFGSLTSDGAYLTSTQVAASDGQPLPSDHPFHSDATAQVGHNRFEMTSNEHDPRRYSAQGFVQRPSFNLSIPATVESPPSVSTSQINYDQEDEDEEDPWDVEMELDEGSVHPSEQSKNELNNMLIMHASHDGRRGIRSFTTFLNHKNVLASYRPSHSALPQADEKAARIFCHFVSSTGPSMSIYERGPSQQPGTSSNTAITGFQQPLWTYTLPSLALHHPPLMHAMLALSALHISKLQQTSPGPSIKHFTYALRRVGRLIGLPKRRNEIATLAANLLLGFYEVMSAETSKWNIHLTGARVLAMEIDFAGKTRKIRALRTQAKIGLAQMDLEQQADYMRCSGIPEALVPDRDWEVDEDLISTFSGYQVRYDYQYQSNTSQPTHQNLEFTPKDVELYKMQADLYWWFCKQDIFQSMISGNRLLMRYDHWVFCPPRGQMGQLNLIYATMDHLCLIMGRLADFGGKDQSRKRRAMAAQSSSTSRPGADTTDFGSLPPPGQGPPIGYMPSPEDPGPLHSAFATMTANLNDAGFMKPKPSTTAEDHDLEAETAAAFAEHKAIGQALELFASTLPDEFDPLPADAAPPISTPFGPALQYRTHTISCIWAFYLSGRILHARLHPSMPPAAMISAQVASAQTAHFAQKIGKICAGLYYPQQYNLQTGSLNPSLGGALIESTLFLFFAAVQFTDHAQRGWTINKLKEIARLSGWQTAAAVAAGCEFAWQATGRAGRGPPYTPTMDWRNKDDRVGDKELKRDAKQHQHQKKGMERYTQKDAEAGKEVGGGEEGQGQEPEEERKQKEREEQYFVAAGKDGPSRRRRKSSKQDNSENGRKEKEKGEEEKVGGDDEDDEDTEPAAITHDRKTIGTNPYARTHWALGLLSLDEDVAKLDMSKG